MITSNYMVTREGYVGTVIMEDGTEKYTNFFCRGDFNILTKSLEAMKRRGEIKDFSVNWIKKEVKAGS